jgi:hypothetical protein
MSNDLIPNSANSPDNLPNIPVTQVMESFRYTSKHFWTSPEKLRVSFIYPILYGLALNTIISAAFCVITMGISGKPILSALPEFIFVGLFISFTIQLFISSAHRIIGIKKIHEWPAPLKIGMYGLLSCSGAFLGWTTAIMIRGVSMDRLFKTENIGTFVAIIMFSCAATFIMYFIFSTRERAAKAEAAEAHKQAQVAGLEKRATDAHLRALQAQIEPHFLFNTLANVHSLIDFAPEKAKAMLEALDGMLRASLNKTRADKTTLGEEFAMVERYLAIFKIRMDDRLTVQTNLAPGLSEIELPPLTLQPLVENAIVHGLEPKIDGGHIHVTATQDADGTIQIIVADTGLGANNNHPTKGTGIGSTNVRERLASFFSGRASLTLTANQPSGTVSTITIKPITPK